MDPIKEAFMKIKQDISSLKQEIDSIKQEIINLKTQKNIEQTQITNPFVENTSKQDPTQNTSFQLNQYQQSNKQTNNPTVNRPLEPLKSQNTYISTGNQGVPTNRQTNQQTNQQTQNTHSNNLFLTENKDSSTNSKKDEFSTAKEILDSLDALKKEIRLKFKRLTPQEMLIFSTLYTLEEEGFLEISYRMVSKKLNLSESSIRDYTNKLIKKGIPIQKTKQNNKKITLSISKDLKRVATLSTIIQLRDI